MAIRIYHFVGGSRRRRYFVGGARRRHHFVGGTQAIIFMRGYLRQVKERGHIQAMANLAENIIDTSFAYMVEFFLDFNSILPKDLNFIGVDIPR